MSDAAADRHVFYGDEAYLAVGHLMAGEEVVQEGEVEVHADADAVDEEDGEVCLGCVWDVPVGKVAGWAVIGAEDGGGPVGDRGKGGC